MFSTLCANVWNGLICFVYGSVVTPCDYGIEPSVLVKGGELLE